METSSYVAPATEEPGGGANAVHDDDERPGKYASKFFLGHSRRLSFNTNVFVRYYVVDMLSNGLGPLSWIVAVPVFGRNGAINMTYLPNNSLKSWVVLTLMSLLFQFFSLVPLIETVLILTGVRTESNYNIFSEGLMVLVGMLIQPIPSGVKYAFMQEQRFKTEVLGPKVTARIVMNSDSDTTTDAIGQWVRPLPEGVLRSEVIRSLWRSGDPEDGQRLGLTLDKRRPIDRETGGGAEKSSFRLGERISLERIMLGVIRRQSGKMQWQFNRKFHPYIYFCAIAIIVSVNPLYKRFILGLPPFGSDTLEVLASVATMFNLCLILMAGTVLRPLICASGHLSRNRRILNDYTRLLLPSLDIGKGWATRMKGGVDGMGECDELGLLSRPVPTVEITKRSIKVWARGREALLEFGKVYWLRLSIFVGCLLIEVGFLVLVLFTQLILSLLLGTRMQISAFVFIVAALLVIFVLLFGLVVLEGMHTTRSKKNLRTALLRTARHFSLSKAGANDDAEGVESELRKVAMEIESELVSHPVKLLGMPLNFTMLESLVGAIVGMGLVFYQVTINN